MLYEHAKSVSQTLVSMGLSQNLALKVKHSDNGPKISNCFLFVFHSASIRFFSSVHMLVIMFLTCLFALLPQ